MGFEDNAGLAQSEPKTAEEINLVRKIEQCTHELFQSINAAEGTRNTINKQLLPLEQDCESEKSTERQEPQGWLEEHLGFLLTIYSSSITTHGKVLRLHKEIKTNKVGQ